MANILRSQGYQVETVEDGQQAVERAARGSLDLVLLDIMMPRLSGLDACRILKGLTSDSFLPVVLVTVKTDSQSRVEGLRLGADDYVCKPFDEMELIARIEAMLRIKRLHDHVNESRKRLETLAVHDELTGVYNYRYLHSRLNEEFKRAERYHDPIACALIDIDQLQTANERGGPAAGDLVIRSLADVIRKSVREIDVVARFGGDEFLVVLPSTHFGGSVAVAERIWREFQARDDGRGRRVAPPCSVSIGVALFPSRDIRTKDALLRAADSALFQAKRDGGNRICVFQQQGYIYSPSPTSEAKPTVSEARTDDAKATSKDRSTTSVLGSPPRGTPPRDQ